MKHVLLLFHHYRTPKDLGGLRSWHIGSYLSKKYKVTAIVPGVDTLTGIKKAKLRGKQWYGEYVNDAYVIWVNSTRNVRTSKFRRILYYASAGFMQFVVSLFTRKVDLAFCTSMPLSSVVIAYVLSRIKRIPLVIDVRDLNIDAALEIGYISSNFVVKRLLSIERYIFMRAHKLLPVSNGMKRILMAKGIPEKNILVMPIGYDGIDVYTKYTDFKRNIKSELGLENKNIVLYAGTMGYVIDIETVLSAARLISFREDIYFLFVGTGQRLDEYRDTAKNCNLNCIFVGEVSKSEIPLYCRLADLCIYPLKGGPIISSLQGNKIFDYMGNGAATIFCGPDGDVKDIIEKSKGGICVEQGDVNDLARKIIELVDKPAKIKEMAKNAKQFIEKEYLTEKIMSKLDEVI